MLTFFVMRGGPLQPKEANMAGTDVERICREVLQLPTREKMLLLSRVMADLSTELGASTLNNIRAMKGVGKEIWKGIDIQDYVDKERASWD
jgi:hypothetical protein